ncbi:hypothetical protein Tco_0899109 [Tanacetum coccineum]
MIDYALWEVIENGATLPKTAVVEGVEKVMPITSAKDKAQRRLEVKARSTLMMGIPNEHHPKWSATTATRGDILLGSAELQENINGLKWDIQVGEITIRELRKKLEKIQKEKDSIQFNVDKFENACKRNFMPPTPDLSFTSLDEFVNKPVVGTESLMKKCLSEIITGGAEAKLILREWHVYFEVFQNRFKRDVKEMKDVFVSVENDLDETFKQNELLKDRLLEASLAEDIKNLVITSCVEIRNKDLHDETERISHESKEVSNESKTADTVCNDAFKITQELSKRIVELEKDLSKFEAKCIAFEIAHSHMARENNYLKTLQKENENFMGSLQIEIAHLKQTYKDLFDSVQRSRVETNECDEVKVKVDFVD